MPPPLHRLLDDWRATSSVVDRLQAEPDMPMALFHAACATAAAVRGRVLRTPAATPADLLIKAQIAIGACGGTNDLRDTIELYLATEGPTGEALCLAVVLDLCRLAGVPEPDVTPEAS